MGKGAKGKGQARAASHKGLPAPRRSWQLPSWLCINQRYQARLALETDSALLTKFKGDTGRLIDYVGDVVGCALCNEGCLAQL